MQKIKDEKTELEKKLLAANNEIEILKTIGTKSKTMVVIGITFEGKSSICNVFAGKAHDENEFKIEGESQEICPKKVFWKGDGDSILLINTPGKGN